jgi:hypothetical protein
VPPDAERTRWRDPAFSDRWRRVPLFLFLRATKTRPVMEGD